MIDNPYKTPTSELQSKRSPSGASIFRIFFWSSGSVVCFVLSIVRINSTYNQWVQYRAAVQASQPAAYTQVSQQMGWAVTWLACGLICLIVGLQDWRKQNQQFVEKENTESQEDSKTWTPLA